MHFSFLYFGHDPYVIKTFSTGSQKIGCRHCDKQFGMNHKVEIILPWSEDLNPDNW